MFINNDIKKQLEQLSNEEENKKCFDCGAQPARMVSLNNGIYLCHSCSEEHKKIEAETNIIKSITLEQWNKNQLNIMKKGGNMKLRIFLEQNNINTNIDKNILYNSKIMLYYRNKLKAEAEEKLLFENLPPRDEFLEPYNIEDNENGNSSNNLDLNELLNMNKNSNNHENNIINSNSGIIINDNQYLNDKIIDYPKNIITIDEDQYSLAKENKSLQKKSQNSILKKDSLLDSINEEENEKYISVGSESNNINNNNSIFQNSGYFGTVGNIIHTVWDTGVQATTNVKEKMNEYTIGKGILYIGGKLVEGVVYIGGKIVHKAGEGISYITQRISRRGGSENNENNNYIDISDNINYDRDKNYKNINLSSDIENNYNIINEKNENLL
jgi:hypothetical protein